MNIDEQKQQILNCWYRQYQKRFFKWTLIFFIVMILLISTICIFSYLNYRHAAENSYYPVHRTLKRNLKTQISRKNALSILYLSINTKNTNKFHKGKVNTMIINTVNPKTNRMIMISMPENMKIKYQSTTIPLDQLYNHGGVLAVINYVQKEMKIPVDYYVLSDMQDLVKTTGQVNGINITPTQTFTNDGIKFQSGKSQALGQKETLAYLKKHDNGNQANYRQQLRNKQVLLALFDKITHDPLSPSATKSLSNDIHTDLSFNDLERLALHYRSAVQNKQDLLFNGDNTQKQKMVTLVHQNLGL